MRYEQFAPKEALQEYCDWILSQLHKFNQPPFEWYFLFYGVRTLVLGYRLLGDKKYLEACWTYLDTYVSEQLPNGALTSNCRGQVAAEMTQIEIEQLLRTGKLNLADNGSNVHALLLASVHATGDRKQRYMDAARKWLECWVPIWGLADGSYGNGIWVGHKLNGPYSMAINVCSAFSAFARITGEKHFAENADGFAKFQCEHWHESGVPIRFNLYPVPDEKSLIGDFGRIFYLMEGLLWTYSASSNHEIKTLIAKRMKEWIHADILPRWPEFQFTASTAVFSKEPQNWFDMNKTRLQVQYDHKEWRDSNDEGLRFYWMASKCCAIPSLLSYYCNCIAEDDDVKLRVDRGTKYLSNPLNARMLGMAADDVEPHFCMQATGFGGLTVAEGVKPGSTFEIQS